jgi:hypothetical protein
MLSPMLAGCHSHGKPEDHTPVNSTFPRHHRNQGRQRCTGQDVDWFALVGQFCFLQCLGGKARDVLEYLAAHCNALGWHQVTHAQLAADRKMSDTTVKRALALLYALGVVKRTEHRIKWNRNAPNTYRLQLHQLQRGGVHDCAGEARETKSEYRIPTTAQKARGGDPSTPLPIESEKAKPACGNIVRSSQVGRQFCEAHGIEVGFRRQPYIQRAEDLLNAGMCEASVLTELEARFAHEESELAAAAALAAERQAAADERRAQHTPRVHRYQQHRELERLRMQAEARVSTYDPNAPREPVLEEDWNAEERAFMAMISRDAGRRVISPEEWARWDDLSKRPKRPVDLLALREECEAIRLLAARKRRQERVEGEREYAEHNAREAQASATPDDWKPTTILDVFREVSQKRLAPEVQP